MPAKTLKLCSPVESEAAIQRAIVRVFEAHDWMVLRLNGSGFYDRTGRFVSGYTVFPLGIHAGAPDLWCWKADGDGGLYLILVEVKTRTGKLSEAQKRFHAAAAARKMKVYVLRSAQEARALLTELESS